MHRPKEKKQQQQQKTDSQAFSELYALYANSQVQFRCLSTKVKNTRFLKCDSIKYFAQEYRELERSVDVREKRDSMTQTHAFKRKLQATSIESCWFTSAFRTV